MAWYEGLPAVLTAAPEGIIWTAPPPPSPGQGTYQENNEKAIV